MRWTRLGWLFVRFGCIVVLGLFGYVFLPDGNLNMPVAVALALAVGFGACGYTLRAYLEPPAERRCPQCNRPVATGMLACGPCGYSFVRPILTPPSQGEPRISWPPSPVKLVRPDVAPAQEAPTSPPAIPIPNSVQQPLLKRAHVPPPPPPGA